MHGILAVGSPGLLEPGNDAVFTALCKDGIVSKLVDEGKGLIAGESLGMARVEDAGPAEEFRV